MSNERGGRAAVAGTRTHEGADLAPAPGSRSDSRAPASPLLSAAGNLAIGSLLAAYGMRAKLSVSQPGDPEEDEADRVADAVVNRSAVPTIQRKCGTCAAGGKPCADCEEKKVDAKRASGVTEPRPASVDRALDAVRHGGHPLPRALRSMFEPRLAPDLSGVSLHTDATAGAAARGIGARAFTVGDRIAFAPGEFRPQDREGQLLLAHELTHVVQQGGATPISAGLVFDPRRRTRGTVQRDAEDPAAVLKGKDELFAEKVRKGDYPAMLVLGAIASLRKLEQSAPQTYTEVRKKLIAEHGDKAFKTAYDNDDRMASLAAKSGQVTARLTVVLNKFHETGQMAAYDFASTKLGEYDFTYPKIFKKVAADGIGVLVILEAFFKDDPQVIVDQLRSQAEAAQADEMAKQAKMADWKEKGKKLVGQTIATRERVFWFNAKISLTSVLEPSEGRETQAEAIAWGRLSGRACAIGKVEDRYYVYDSSDQFTYKDIFATESFEEHRSEVVTTKATPTGLPLITADGYVLTQRDIRFFGGAQSKQPEDFAVGTGALLHQTADLDSDRAIKLFKMATLDLLLLNLKQAELRLRAVLGQAFPGVGAGTPMTISKEFGETIKKDAASLQAAMTRVTNLINRLEPEKKEGEGDKPPVELTEQEEVQLTVDLETIGRIHTQNPGAAMMVINHRDPESTKPVAEGEIENKTADRLVGDAAWDVAKETKRRIDNVDLVRRHFFKNLDDTLSLEPLHDQLLPNFTATQQVQIKLARFGHSVATIAKIIGLTVLELVFIITGALIGGPLGAILAGGATGIGAGQAVEGLQDAKLTAAKAAIDVPGKFQLATPQEAEAATKWAYIGVALSILDVGELASGGRLVKLLGRGAARAARGVGAVAIETLYWARRTLGLPTDVVANLTLAGVRRLQSLSAEMLERFARLSDTLKRVLLGCTSPCRVDLAEIQRFLSDPARKVTASTKPLTTVEDVLAALPPGSKFNRGAVRQYLKDHPAAMTFIRESGISADDLSGLTALDVVSKGDLSEETARRTFSRYLTSLVPAKVGPDINEFLRISEAAAKAEGGSAASALKGAMFENFARLYITDFRTMNLGRRAWTDAMIKDLEASRRTSDALVSEFGELWDFKNVAGPVDQAQVRDYQRILNFERRRGQPAVTSINYLFATKEGAEANARLVALEGINVWYLGPSGRRIRLR